MYNESTYLAIGGGKVLFNIIVRTRMFGPGTVPKETGSRLFNLVPSLSDSFSKKNCLKWDVWARHGAERDLILPIQLFNLKILDLYLEILL